MAIVGAFVLPHPPLIIPAVGRGKERGIARTVAACEEVARRVSALAPDTIVISSPHTTLYRDYFHVSPGPGAKGSFAAYGAPEAAYEVTYDEELVRELVREAQGEGLSLGTDYEREPRLDHATMIAVHFVEQHLKEFKVVRIGLSGMAPKEHYLVGRCVQRAAEALGRRVVYLASGDLSHKLLATGPYGFAPEGPVFDERVCHDLASGDLCDLLAIDASVAERAAECGLRSFQMMVGALDHTRVATELLSHEGPFGVGYGVACLTLVGEAGACAEIDRLGDYLRLREEDLRRRREEEDPYVRLARATIEAYVGKGKKIAIPRDLPAELLRERAGCFVSLKIDGQLRGCIGTIAPVRTCLAEEIRDNAISAATRDRRFMPVTAEELPDIVYDVDVLTPAQPIASFDELDPSRYGVIVSASRGRRGLLLPDLDGVDTVEEQVRIAAQKGGIDIDYDDYRLERFEVVRHL